MVLGNEWGYEISDMAIRAASAARPRFCWKGSCCEPRLINCFWKKKKKKKRKHTQMIWANVPFLSWCKSGADPLIFAWLRVACGGVLDSTLRVIVQAKVCGADQPFPPKSAAYLLLHTLIPEAHEASESER